MKYVIKTLAVVALGAQLASSNKDNPTENGLTENQKKMASVVENYVPNVVYGTYKALADETENLYNALDAASQKGVNALTQSDLDAISRPSSTPASIGSSPRPSCTVPPPLSASTRTLTPGRWMSRPSPPR